MANLAYNGSGSQDYEQLLDGWLEQERSGEQFPVPFDVAWGMAGYSNKANAKRALPKPSQGALFIIYEEKSGGRPREVIRLSVDGMKHLCLMAQTDQGYAIRQYFIEAERKWRLVQQVAPAVAEEVEILNLKIELAKLEAQKQQAELQTIQLRHLITQTCPEPVQQKIFGHTEIKVVEEREVVVDRSTGNRYSGAGITEIAKRYGLKSTKDAWRILEQIGYGKDSPHWHSEPFVGEHLKIDRNLIPTLDALFAAAERNLYLGE